MDAKEIQRVRRLLIALGRSELTYQEALDIFGGRPLEAADLKIKQRQLLKENHPDRGGSPEMMSKVNQAFDILVGKTKPKPSYDYRPPAPAQPRAQPAQPAYYDSAPKYEEPKIREVSFSKAEADAGVPSGVTWKFVTPWQRAKDNYSGDESSRSLSAFVAYGVTDSQHVFVAASYYEASRFTIGMMSESRIWLMHTFKYPLNDKEAVNPAFLTGKVVAALKFHKGEFEFTGRFNNKVTDAEGWKFGERLPVGSPVSIKHWLVNSGQVQGDAPAVAKRKNVIELALNSSYEDTPGFYHEPHNSSNFWGGKYYGDNLKLTLIVNGKPEDISEKDAHKLMSLRIGGKKALEAIFGPYAHQGGRKTLNRLGGGKALLFIKFIADNFDGISKGAKDALTATAQQLS